MKKMRMMAGVIAFLFLLTGCGTKTPSTGTTGASSAPAASSSTAASAAPASSAPASNAAPAATVGSNKKIKIAVVPKLVGIPYFNASETGAKKAGQDLGVEVIYTGPTQADAAQQVKVIEDLISQKVNAIAVAPNDPAALTPVLKKAKDQGITILDWDTPADQSIVDLSIHQIDDEQFGRHFTDVLVQKMGTDTADVAILTGGLAAANLNTFIDWAKKQAQEKYPKLHFVSEKIPTDEKQQVAYQKTLDLIKAYPNLKGIIAMSTPAPLGAAQAIQEKKLQDKIQIVGSALPKDSMPFFADGSLDVGILWDPGKLGYLTVSLAKDLVEGKKPKDGDDVKNVGKIQVKDKTVIMGPPTDFTKENAGNFNF